MRIIDCEQGSAEWLHARAGKITASRMADMLNYLKRGGESQKRADYRTELVAERLTSRSAERYVSPEMRWGVENEGLARSAYEVATGAMLDQVGFVLHPSLDFTGASPDGLCGTGGAEFKCPQTTTHIEYMAAGVVPDAYIPQMMWEMACCEREWMDFVSFDPRLPDDLQLFVRRLPRDNALIAEMEDEVVRFDREIEQQIGRIYANAGLERPGVEGTAHNLLHARLLESVHRAPHAG